MRVGRVSLSSLSRDERGIAATVLIVSMVFIVAMAALVIDGGNLFSNRRAIVNAADAGALAAAQSYANALGGAACGSNDGPAQGAADASAAANISSPTRIFYACPSAAGAGTVRVGYQATVSGLFSGSRVVSTASTAAWGPTLGGPGLLPFQLDSTQVEGACGVPSPTVGATCNFWYDANNASSQWGFLNLCSADAAAHGFCPSNKVGWNVSPSTQCPNTGSISKSVIQNGFPYALTMNPTPPTYVCIDTGFSSGDFTLIPIGQVGVFPVAVPPPLLKNGSPDKYSIIGFTALKIIYVGKGNDAQTITECGNPPSWVKPPASNAECIKMEWIGPQEVPGDICPSCQDLGVHSIKLQG
jgi:Flp pilus assembly protein TadG